MSYLNPLRLHFAGSFQAAPSTVNNDPVHFNNAAFVPDYQLPQTNGAPNGWWNPRGNASFRLMDCTVTAAWAAGKPLSGDPVLQCRVADSNTRVAAKIVDLDPQNQGVSEIWGLEVRISSIDGRTLARGQFKPAALEDLWTRVGGGRAISAAGAMYQSVLEDVEWGDVSKSAFLQSLKAAAPDSRLSIKFNLDGYISGSKDARFTRGRIVGTIGPVAANEPDHFVLGRHVMTTASSRLNYCSAYVDEQGSSVYVDLGNSLPTDSSGGSLSNVGTISLACLLPPDANGNAVPPRELGPIAYTGADWYGKTAGVAVLQVNATDLAAVQGNPLAIVLTDTAANKSVDLAERADGLYVRADQFVFRLNPGDKASAHLYATRFGRRYPAARITTIFDPTSLGGGSNIGTPPPIATPETSLQFPTGVIADAQGEADLPMEGHDPENPRGYIDGQIFGIRPVLEEALPPSVSSPYNQSDFISILVWDQFKGGDPPTWFGSIQPIFQQYANLYPVMDTLMKLGEYDAVCSNRTLLLLAFSLPVADPNSMPVTRDLSAAKREAIIRWLRQNGPDGKPLKGVAVQSRAAVAPVATSASAQEQWKFVLDRRRLNIARKSGRKGT